MSTRCRIALERADGTIKSIYCHFDGYPEGVGAVLKKHYTDPAKIEELLELGDISRLGTFYDEKLAKMDWEQWEKPKEEREKIRALAEEMTLPYKDRGEKDVEPRIDENINVLIEKLRKCGEEFTYLFSKDYTGVYTWEVCESPYFKEF